MQKKTKNNRKKQRTIMFGIVGAGLVLVALAVSLLANKGGIGSTTNNDAAKSGSAPQLSVNTDKIDFGVLKFNTPTTFEFEITNTGNANLVFSEEPYVEVKEGCWPPQVTIGSMVLKPGESTTIKSGVFMMHEGMDGPHDFRVKLVTNDLDQPEKELVVLSDWVP